MSDFEDPTDPAHIAALRADAARRRRAAEHHPRARSDPDWAEAVRSAADLAEGYADLLASETRELRTGASADTRAGEQ